MLSITRYSVQNSCLAPWVKFIWRLEADNADIHLKLLPTDSVDVILNLSGDMVYETGSREITAPPFHINGLRSEHSYIHQSGQARVLGISFYPYGLYPFVSQSLERTQGEIVDLHSLSTPLAQKLKSAVAHSAVQDIAESIENVLCAEMNANDSYMGKAKLMHDFIGADDSLSIRHFCVERGVNIKTFERMVSRYTGYTPKVLRRIRRFQTASNQLIHNNTVNISGIAYDNSFADQSHFTKEFRRFSGAAPCAFLREKITVKESAEYSFI